MKTFSFQTHFQNGNAFIYKSFAKQRVFETEVNCFQNETVFIYESFEI